LWAARYQGPGRGDDYPVALALDNAGNIYVTGASAGDNDFEDYATVKYNSNGNLLWVARFDGDSHGTDYPSGLAVDDGGDVFGTGSSWRTDPTTGYDYDFVTVKYNSNGQRLWAARYSTYSTPGHDLASTLALD